MDQLFPKVGISTVKILEELGHEVDFPKGQTCCGQPAFNAGYWNEAREVASKFIDVFEHAETIVCPSGSCTTMVRKFYSDLFKNSTSIETVHAVSGKIYELSEFLVHKLGVTKVGARFPGKVTWHDACHGLRELGLKREPRQLLSEVDGLDLVETQECEVCCGFGGTFSVKFPDISTAMNHSKIESLEKSGADFVASGDSSCLMQIDGLLRKQKSRMRTIHIAEILASR